MGNSQVQISQPVQEEASIQIHEPVQELSTPNKISQPMPLRPSSLNRARPSTSRARCSILENCNDTSGDIRSVRLRLTSSFSEDYQLASLGPDLLQEIVGWFGPQSIGKFAAVSKAADSYGMNQALWKALCIKAWPTLMPFIRKTVVHGNYRQLFKTRTIALALEDDDDDGKNESNFTLQDYVFTLTFETSRTNMQTFENSCINVQTLSFVLKPDAQGKSTVEFLLPFDVDPSKLILRGSLYQCATGATVKLDLSEGEAWWIDESDYEEDEDMYDNQWTDTLDLTSYFEDDNMHEMSVLIFQTEDNSHEGLQGISLQGLKNEAARLNAKCIGSKKNKLNWINAIKDAIGAKKAARVEITFGSLHEGILMRDKQISCIQDVVGSFMKYRA
jgi:hypothetical protein